MEREYFRKSTNAIVGVSLKRSRNNRRNKFVELITFRGQQTWVFEKALNVNC